MTEIGDAGEKAAVGAAGGSFFLSTLIGMSNNIAYGFINMIQPYVYTPLFENTLPGNLSSFLKFFMGIASCDLVTNDYVFVEILYYEPTSEQTLTPYNESFEDLGFETKSMVYNLGDLALIQFYILVLIAYLVILKIASRFSNRFASRI
jgi:hypothetical protein